ncbi:hypothetical protein, partial [Escherichia coli]|uniref:hypothetical protein n=1 Tax=Escherichia coli TaxID=562 RepID=UPI001BC86F29
FTRLDLVRRCLLFKIVCEKLQPLKRACCEAGVEDFTRLDLVRRCLLFKIVCEKLQPLKRACCEAGV